MNDTQLLHYSRQILLPQVEIAGQQRLLQAKVLIVGLGGLGSPVAMYLAAAGVGHLVLADFDNVELSNLQRQIVHDTQQIGQAKSFSAQQTLKAINPEIKLTLINQPIEEANLTTDLDAVDIVVDCSDNFATRFAINAACVKTEIPLVSGAALRWHGQVTVFLPKLPTSPCYHCLYPEIEEVTETCSQNGLLAPLVGIIGSIQATQVIKVLLNIGESLCGKLLILEAHTMQWRTLKLFKDPACPVCSQLHLAREPL
jgi:adenylyltransferase/sulfurtransferase